MLEPVVCELGHIFFILYMPYVIREILQGLDLLFLDFKPIHMHFISYRKLLGLNIMLTRYKVHRR